MTVLRSEQGARARALLNCSPVEQPELVIITSGQLWWYDRGAYYEAAYGSYWVRARIPFRAPDILRAEPHEDRNGQIVIWLTDQGASRKAVEDALKLKVQDKAAEIAAWTLSAMGAAIANGKLTLDQVARNPEGVVWRYLAKELGRPGSLEIKGLGLATRQEAYITASWTEYDRPAIEAALRTLAERKVFEALPDWVRAMKERGF